MIDKYKSGFMGSPQILTSSTQHELVEKGVFFHKFSFFNYQDCTVSINGSEPIFLAAEQGFSTSHPDKLVDSFVIIEANVNFNWVGAIKHVSISR